MSRTKKVIWLLAVIFVIFPVALTVILALIGVGNSPDASSKSDAKNTHFVCDQTEKEMLDTIQSGMISTKYKIAGRGQVMLTAEQNSEITAISPGWDKNYVIAADISGGSLKNPVVGLWGKSGNTGALFALNESALKYSDWGTAANDGSPAYQIRLKLLRFGTTQGALSCGK